MATETNGWFTTADEEAAGLRLDGRQVNDADQLLGSGGTRWQLSAGRKRHARIVVKELDLQALPVRACGQHH